MTKQDYTNPDFRPAIEYGRLVKKKGRIVTVSRIRLYDGHNYNWSQQLRWNHLLYTPTDQTYDLEASTSAEISFYDEVWFDGVCIYKKPWYSKLIDFFKVG